MRRRTLSILAVMLLLGVSDIARADILHLMNGGRIEGKVTKTPDGYRVETETGVSEFHDDQVRYWEKKPLPDEVYKGKADALADDDFQGHLDLGVWCRKNGMKERSEWHFMLAIALRPDSSKARSLAGYVKYKGRWVEYEESMRLKGYRKYDGKWLPAALAERKEHEDLTQEKQKEIYAAAWKLLRESYSEVRVPSLERQAEKILQLDNKYLYSPLSRASTDGTGRIRRLSYVILGRMETEDSLTMLFDCLKVEKDGGSARFLQQIIAGRSDRSEVLRLGLYNALNSRFGGVRKRSCKVLDMLGDKRAIDSLIPLVEREVVFDAPESKPSQIVVGDDKVDAGRDKERKPVRPAHQALIELTGMLLPASVDAWQGWWKIKREDFRFPSQLPKPGDKPEEENKTEEKQEPEKPGDKENNE